MSAGGDSIQESSASTKKLKSVTHRKNRSIYEASVHGEKSMSSHGGGGIISQPQPNAYHNGVLDQASLYSNIS